MRIEVRRWCNARAKHINYQLNYMQSNNCIYTKYGDSPNVGRSNVKTITFVENNKDNKREA
jgi:hypothetical protein